MLLGLYIFVDDDFQDPIYGEPSSEDLDEDEFLTFLVLAEAYRRFGVNHIPRGQDKLDSTLLPDKTWKVFIAGEPPFPAEDIGELPLWRPESPLEFWGLSPKQLDILKKYGRKP